MGQNSAGHSDLGAADFRIIEQENKLGHHLHLVGNCNILTCISVKKAQGLSKASTGNDHIFQVPAKRTLRLHWYFALLASNIVFITFETLEMLTNWIDEYVSVMEIWRLLFVFYSSPLPSPPETPAFQQVQRKHFCIFKQWASKKYAIL